MRFFSVVLRSSESGSDNEDFLGFDKNDVRIEDNCSSSEGSSSEEGFCGYGKTIKPIGNVDVESNSSSAEGKF